MNGEIFLPVVPIAGFVPGYFFAHSLFGLGVSLETPNHTESLILYVKHTNKRGKK